MIERKTLQIRWSVTLGLSCLFILSGILIGTTPVIAPDGTSCVECHEDLAKAFLTTPHAAIDAKKMAELSCTACHGDAAKHLEEGEAGTIFAFKKTDSPVAKSAACIECHTAVAARYPAANHAKAGMDCTSCHAVHRKDPTHMKNHTNAMCSSCHMEVAAEFKLNERHRLQEGILECTSCHNPHEPATRERLGGFKSEACFECHTDKSGPFLHEHEAGVLEGCGACHDVHGSPNRHMLKFQRVPDLCFSCHTYTPSWHSRFLGYGGNCVTCHATIHGSNLDRIFLK